MGTVKYSGPVASFHCPTEATIRSLKVHFSPKQEGSGDPSPENIRPIVGWDGVEVQQNGKNLVNISNDNIIYQNFSRMTDGSYYQISGNTVILYNQNAKSLMVCFAVMPITSQMVGVSFTLNANATGNGDYGIFLSDLDGSNRTSNRANPYTIASGDVGKLIGARVRMNNISGTYTVSNIQFEFGSNATNYELYKGVTTNYEFGVLGKNKFDKDNVISDSWIRAGNLTEENPLGTIKENATGYALSQYIKVSPNTVYTIKYNKESLATAAGMVFFSEQNANSAISGVTLYDQTYSTPTTTREYYTFTTLSNCNYLRISTPPNCSNVQLELGSTATAYEPYDPKHTVYGGWVDLISGEVCATHEMADLSDLEWSVYSGNRCNTTDLSFLIKKSSSYSSLAPLIGEQVIAGRMSMNLSDFPDAVACNINGTLIKYYDGELPQGKIVYELAEPIAYQLAPTSMQTFLGQNNVWSNADYVEVEYDLHETQTILARKQFIIANQPHVVKPAAAPLQNFVTDVPASLKECKVYFSPVQEGTGDPSPDNVRPISGWTGIEVMRSPKNIFPKSLPEQLVKGNWSTGSTSISAATNARCFSIYIGTNRTLKFTKTGVLTMQLAFTDSPILDRSNTLYGAVNCANRATYTLNSNEHPYLGISIVSVSAWDTLEERECILRFNETPEGFEARVDWEPIPIDWTDSAGTIYGGYVDLVTGEVWKTWDIVKLKDYTWGRYTNYQFYLTLSKRDKTSTEVISDTFSISKTNTYPTVNKTIGFYSGGQGYANIIFIKYEDSDNVNDFNVWLQSLENEPVIAYKLAVPELVTTLIPQQLSTLRGTNNIWSNSNGDITVQFWKH